MAGRRKGRRCVAGRKRGKRCKAFRRVKGFFKRSRAAGRDSFRFTGRMAGKRLRRGSCRLVITGVDGAGHRARAKRLGFTIMR